MVCCSDTILFNDSSHQGRKAYLIGNDMKLVVQRAGSLRTTQIKSLDAHLLWGNPVCGGSVFRFGFTAR